MDEVPYRFQQNHQISQCKAPILQDAVVNLVGCFAESQLEQALWDGNVRNRLHECADRPWSRGQEFLSSQSCR